MNLDINKILNLAKTFMPNKVKQLENAINKAQEVLRENEGKSPSEILKNTGVSQEFLEKLRQNTSNPLANIFMQAVGLDVKKANDILDDIKTSNEVSNPTTSSTKGEDDIKTLKQALNKVKKN